MKTIAKFTKMYVDIRHTVLHSLPHCCLKVTHNFFNVGLSRQQPHDGFHDLGVILLPAPAHQDECQRDLFNAITQFGQHQPKLWPALRSLLIRLYSGLEIPVPQVRCRQILHRSHNMASCFWRTSWLHPEQRFDCCCDMILEVESMNLVLLTKMYDICDPYHCAIYTENLIHY